MSKKLGLALGGGGAWSIAGLGVIKALVDSGIKIDYLAGCSMGAMITAAYASNFAGEDTIGRIEEILTNTKMSQVIHFKSHHRFGLFSSEKIGHNFEELVGKLNIEDLSIPLSIIATDFKTGEQVVFNKGSLTEAISASASFGLIFTPYEHQGRLLTDGGFSNPTPVDVVKQMGADITVGIDITSKRHLKRTEVQPKWYHKITSKIPPLHYLVNRHLGKTTTQIIDLLFSNINRIKLEQNPPDFLLIPEVTHHGQFNFKLTPEFIKQGEKVTLEIISELKKRLG